MYVSNDLVNGTFEALGSLFIFRNCWFTYRDKAVKGISILTTVFFTSWGFWNTYFYPSLHQWYSFLGGLCIVIANCLWIYLMFKYRKN